MGMMWLRYRCICLARRLANQPTNFERHAATFIFFALAHRL